MQVDLDTRSLRLESMVPCGYGAVASIAWSANSKHIVAVCDKSEAPPGAVAPETTVLLCSPGVYAAPTPITTGPGSVNAIVWTLDGNHTVSTDRGQHLVCISISFCIWLLDHLHTQICLCLQALYTLLAVAHSVYFAIATVSLHCIHTCGVNSAVRKTVLTSS